MTTEAQLKKEKLWKLNPRAHIGYLIGYESTNIYKIWVPHRGEVEIQNEEKRHLLDLEEADEIEFSHQYRDHDENDDIIEDVDEPVMDTIVVNTSRYFGTEDQIGQLHGNQDDQDSQHPEKAKGWEGGIPTPPLTDPDIEEGPQSVFAVNLPVQSEGVRALGSVFTTTTSMAKESIDWDDQEWLYNNRFSDFERTPVETAVHGMFVAGTQFKPKKIHKRNIPEAPKTLKDLANHPLRDEFRMAQKNHLKEHENMGLFSEVPWNRVKGARILSSMWVFTYKTDKHGFLVRCKARLVVCGNQQEKGDLPTRATILARMSFRALMAIAAEYDLELEQMDAVNAFVNCDLDEIVYMKMPPGFEKYGRVLWLRKALYGLRRSPLLWQKDLTKSPQELGFKTVPQEPCVMIKGKVIVFFFVDDIIWAYRKDDEMVAKKAIEGLKTRYKMSLMGEPKWFLGIHILRDRHFLRQLKAFAL
ncbi:polyprotein, partial [Metarhizium majus ARSEF 297]